MLVTTVRATKSHGGMLFKDLSTENLDAIRKGADNLSAHIQIVRQYGLPCVVAVNSFPTDTAAEIALVRALATAAGAETVVAHNGFGQGGDGAVELANAVVAACDKPNTFDFLTRLRARRSCSRSKRSRRGCTVRRASICRCRPSRIWRRSRSSAWAPAQVCMAKTQMSLSHDAALRNRPKDFILPVRGMLPSAGAGFVVALCGDMQRMPGLGKTPAFQNIDIDAQGRTVGLFLIATANLKVCTTLKDGKPEGFALL